MSNVASSPEADPASVDLAADGAAAIEGRTPWQLIRARLRKDKKTLVVGSIALCAVLVAILSPLLQKFGVLDAFTTHQDLLNADGGLPIGPFSGASLEHPLGLEPRLGRDVLSRVAVGISTSLAIALLAALVAVVIGTVLGLIAGYSRKGADFWISRLIDMTLSFPQTLMLLALSGPFTLLLTKSLHVPEGDIANGLYVILVLGLFGWPTTARVVRGQVLSLREREFVEAARSLGATRSRIYLKELLPNLWAPILVYATLLLPTYISAEAALSYLGVGIKPPTPTLGNILTNSVTYAESDFTFFFIPAALIAILVISFNLLGDGLRDALDPKSSR